MVRNLLTRGLLGLLVALAALPARAEFSATVDRREVNANDVVVLELRLDDQVFIDEPDFSGLEQDFRILGAPMRSSQLVIRGRERSSVTTWKLTLEPRREGTLQIPAIEYEGERTRPISIRVTEPSPEERARMERTVFLESQVSRDEVRVQEQLLYRVRLHYAADAVLFGDLPEPPEIEDAVLQPLGEARPSVEVRDGIRYNVIEQRYAIVPQASGTLRIPPEHFTGAIRMADRGQTRRKNLRIESDGHEVRVRPRPASWPDDVPWLPARDLTLSENWDRTPPRLRAGEPAGRTIELSARGVTASTLPEIRVGEEDGFRLYPDPPRLDEGMAAGRFVATRIQSMTLIPEQAGTLRLPEIRVPWWDTQNDEMRVAVLPGRRLEVRAGNAPETGTGSGAEPERRARTRRRYGSGSTRVLVAARDRPARRGSTLALACPTAARRPGRGTGRRLVPGRFPATQSEPRGRGPIRRGAGRRLDEPGRDPGAVAGRLRDR
ncbi:MAG: BatD family protein [Gammaproteobacteria bacterium]|nr:BatD family protein [Gammaproteobacteria bacterium]